jgi:hypothetical protein
VEKSQNKPKEKKKLFSFLEQDEEVKNLGVYEKKDINDEVTKKIDPKILVDEKEEKKKKIFYFLSGFFIFLIFIPPLFQKLDPNYEKRDPTYQAEIKSLIKVKSQKMICILDNAILTRKFEGVYYNSKAVRTVMSYKYKTTEYIKPEAEKYLEIYTSLTQGSETGIKLNQKENDFTISVSYLKNKNLKKNKKIEKFSVSMDVAKNNLEEEDYKCSVSSQGEFEIKREEYNVLG